MSWKCFAVHVAVLLVGPLVASGQGRDTVPVGATTAPSPTPVAHMKSPVLAPILSVFLPGGGQMYAGKGKKGLGLLGIFTVGAVIGTAATAGCAVATGLNSEGLGNAGNDCSRSPGFTILGVVVVGTYAYSIVSAPFDVRQYNTRQQHKHAARVQPMIQSGAMDKFGRTSKQFGLSVRL